MAQDIDQEIADEREAILDLHAAADARADAERLRLIDADKALELSRLRSERSALERAAEPEVEDEPQPEPEPVAPEVEPEPVAPEVEDEPDTPQIADVALISGRAKE